MRRDALVRVSAVALSALLAACTTTGSGNVKKESAAAVPLFGFSNSGVHERALAGTEIGAKKV